MKRYQAVLKYYGTDGRTKTVPVGKWQRMRDVASVQLVVAIRNRAQDKKVPAMVQPGWIPCGDDIREKTVK